jgi:kinesin family member C2/C3
MDMEQMAGFDADSDDRLSDISDGGLSMGTETDGSSSLAEFAMFSDQDKTPAPPPPPQYKVAASALPVKDKV